MQIESTDDARDTRGRFKPGNLAALKAGANSLQMLAETEAERERLANAMLVDRGHDLATAPRTLVLLARNAAAVQIVCDNAWARMIASGGPLNSKGAESSLHRIWSQHIDRLHRLTDRLTYERKEKQLDALDYLAAHGAERA